ncbi:hypothetical protein BKP35_00605 [Anaerobacillus arseniciselenatis]|uniref:Transposase n=1 Tax=Anaerobacillus arseniciselenatis TaxID=85682 RepID=A0A1S2LSN9_9BACI|nr:Rpn family recombination-promoting nuclease/putative transposase [Anaerobacillus arseniciselenatis]OIJ15528.1 hypothetical protein BKP35_00605 [Anaerobacillus arseniciselenatis]
MNINELMDLKIDYAFKQLFGNPKNKRITIEFLNAMLERTDREKISDVQFENTLLSKEHLEDKESRLDILARTTNDELINIEIQFNNKFNMVKRSIYYWARVFSDQLQKGQGYINLRPVIMINIVNYNLFRRETKKFHTTFHLYEDKDAFQLTNDMEFHFVEIPKLLVQWKQERLNPRDDLLARWLLLLGTVDKKEKKAYKDILSELEAIALKDEVLRDALYSWEELSADRQKRYEYEARLKKYLDEISFIEEQEYRYKQGMEKALKDGMEKGIEQGLQKGMQQGIEQGIEKGKQQGEKEALKKVALGLSEEGVPLEMIVKLTGLTKEEVEQLVKNK